MKHSPTAQFPPQLAPPPQPGTPADRDGDGLDIHRYLNALRRRWPLVAVCCLVAVAYGLVKFSLTTKEYRSSTLVQIERKRLSTMALGQNSYLEDWWNMEYYPTQYRLLASRGLAERVVTNLRLAENPMFTGTGNSLAAQDSEQAVTAAQDQARIASLAMRLQGGLSVDPVRDTQLVRISYVSHSPILAAQISQGFAEALIEWGAENRSATVGRASGLLTEQIESLQAEIRQMQEDLARLGNAATSEFALDPDGQALVERKKTLEEQLNRVIGDRVNKQALYETVANQPDSRVAAGQAGGRITQLNADLAQLEGEYSAKSEEFASHWPMMQDLAQKIEEKRAELNQLVLETAIQVRSRARGQFDSAQREERRLEQELRQVKATMAEFNSDSLNYNNVKDTMETKQALLADLLKQQTETDVVARVDYSRDSNVRIVDTAIVPSAPYRPILRRDLTSALLFGLVLGLAGIALLEFLDRSVKSPEELEKIMQLPILSVIPDVNQSGRNAGSKRYGYSYGYGYSDPELRKSASQRLAGMKGDKKGQAGKSGKGERGDKVRIELLPHLRPRLAVCEAYRSLRTALLLSSAEELRVVALTSAEPGEGKTATVSNLGVVMAQLGRRVLIIDGDLRRPRLHKVFRVSNRVGLVNFLTGTSEPDQLYFQTQVQDLWICPCGPIPPNPSELLASERMQEMLATARDHFDFVLIDTPPTLPVADAVILGTRADGVVICTKAGVLREDARACRERLAYSDIRVLGAVLNRYRASAARYAKRYHYYGAYEQSLAEVAEVAEAADSSAA